MKVLLANGSPHKNGVINEALKEIAETLKSEGIDSEIYFIGPKPIRGCTACGACRKTSGKCAFGDEDGVNEFIEKLKGSDGLIIGSAVHYASASGTITAFMDRVFYASSKAFAYKPGAAIVSCRRGGASSTFDQLIKYFTIANMPLVPSQYWNMVYGNTPEEARQDLEGMQTMRTLARNMAWMLKAFEAAKEKGIEPPQQEPKQGTNFIR